MSILYLHIFDGEWLRWAMANRKKSANSERAKQFRTDETISELGAFHYPRYDELPDDLVFLNDIVDIVNQVHAPLDVTILNSRRFTASMASNYIKKGLTPTAIGKKYGRKHICIILLAASVKMSYSTVEVLNLVHAVFDGLETDEEVAHVQNHLSESIDRNMHNLGRVNPGDTMVEYRDRDMLVELLSASFAAKAAALTLTTTP